MDTAPFTDDDETLSAAAASRPTDCLHNGLQDRAALHRLAVILNSAECAIVAKDGHGVVTHWNPGAEALYGYTASEVVGRSISLLAPATEMLDWDELQARSAKGERIYHHETQRLSKSGALIDIALTLSPLRDELGEIVGTVAFTHDITESKRMRAHVALTDRLAAIGQLAAGVAHEVNNPLTFILANIAHAISELEERPKDQTSSSLEDVIDTLRAAEQGARLIREITKDLKLLARGGDDRVGIVDVQRAIDSAVNMANIEIKHRGRLIKDYGPVRPIFGNDTRLAQVVLNLVLNAAQALPDPRSDASEIRITTRQQGTNVVIRVSDTGPGIDAADLPLIFEPFFTTKRLGTGLGLSISRDIIKGLGGTLTVKSEPGHGAEFIVEIPAS